MCSSVGYSVGYSLGYIVGVGDSVGSSVGCSVVLGYSLGYSVRDSVGYAMGCSAGYSVEYSVGYSLGVSYSVGYSVGFLNGLLSGLFRGLLCGFVRVGGWLRCCWCEACATAVCWRMSKRNRPEIGRGGGRWTSRWVLLQVAEKLIQNGVDSLMGLRLLDVQDLVSLGIMPLQAKIIMTRCHELSGKDKDFHGPEPAVPDADAGDARDGRRRRRRENPTFMTAPGTNFMTLIEEAGGSVEAVIDKLKAYAADAAKAKLCIKEFQEELERYKTDPQGTTKALLWLYSLDCWVYQDCNRACREDKKSLLEYFMPFIKAVLQGIPKASDLHVGTSDAGATLYRRTKLTADQQSKYSEGTKFIWTGFTSTSLEDTNPEFGPHLFVISIPHKFLSKLPKLDSVSAFPEEHEVLLPCNIGLAVTSTGPSTRPGTTLEVALKVQYEINCIW